MPFSAAASLFTRSMRLSLAGIAQINLPYGSSDLPTWVPEGQPIPSGRSTFATTQLGPVRRLAILESITDRIAALSAVDAEAVVGQLMRAAAARALDQSLFDDVAGDISRPPGLRFGVAGLTPTAGAVLDAVVDDLGALAQAITNANTGGDLVFVAAPSRALRARILVPGLSDVPVLQSAALPADMVIAVNTLGFASSVTDPQLDASNETVIHEETVPQEIGVAGSATVPMRSMLQTSTISLRLQVRAA